MNRLLLAASLALASLAPPAGAAQYGDVSVLAQVPVPNGFPEGIAVSNGRVYVAGPATFGTSVMNQPSRVFEFNATTGALTRTFITQGEKILGAEHADSCLAFDSANRLYVLNTQIGTFRLDLATGVQQSYTPPFPDIGICLPGLLRKPGCAPALANLPPLPNDIVFDPSGYAYVTDSMQSTIWRIPPGGGAPQPWFQDLRFASPYIGVNGLRLSPDRTQLFISVTVDLAGRGTIYTLPLVDQPQGWQLQAFHRYTAGGPDGMAFGKSGKLYVALALPGSSGISVLEPDGTQSSFIGNARLSPFKPFDSPANIAFDGQGNLLVTNHAFATGLLLPAQFQILKVYVNDVESPLVRPVLP